MNYKKIITWISTVGSIASLLGLIYIFFPLKENPIKLNFIVTSCDNLTVFNNESEPEIKAQFEYKGNKITKLWKLNVLFKNVSEKTIIGNGQLKNIMFDNLVFFIKDSYQIIDKKMIKSEFNHNLSILGNDTIHLSFGQWRTEEKLEYSFYITTELNDKPGIEIFYQPKDRQIIDGDILFIRETPNNNKELVTNKLGIPTKKVIYALFLLMISISLLVIIGMIISTPVGYVKKKKWLKLYLNSYNEHVNDLYSNNKKVLQQLFNKPESYANWSSFNGKKYPKDRIFDLEINNFFALLITMLVFGVLTFVELIVVIDLIQIFP